MIKQRLKATLTIIALAFYAGALFFAFYQKDLHICADEYVISCAHTQLGVSVDRGLIEGLGALASFTTYFDGANSDRAENMRLAADSIDGFLLAPGGVFSFNAAVGARTAERGYKKAKIIVDGRFVQGTGGGVCQVSTTLYNAALLAGLEICEYHPHSLQVFYVPPSRDAMVSGSYFDLKFKNPKITPVLIRMHAATDAITCTIYGQSDGYSYSLVSQITQIIPKPPAIVVEGEEDKILSFGRDGVQSEGYLIRTKGGVEQRRLMRKDSYPAIADVIQVKKQGV